MYSHGGPLWSTGVLENYKALLLSGKGALKLVSTYDLTMLKYVHTQAKVNIPCISERSIRRGIEASGVSLNASIQVL